MPNIRPILFASMLVSSVTSAQITLEHTSPDVIRPLHSLGSGLRYITNFEPNQPSTIYNLDWSVHRVLNYPAPPSGMSWSNMGYITEDLFDTDPSTIEFMLTAHDSFDPGSAVFVYREDGTQLFAKNPGSIISMLGMGHFSQGIYTIGDESFMLIHETGVMGPPTHVYALPGILPCIDCRGTPALGSGVGINPSTDFASGISLYPNPANETFTVDLVDQACDEVRITDVHGAVVKSTPVNGGGQLLMSTSGLASGRYSVQVVRNGHSFATLPLVVQH